MYKLLLKCFILSHIFWITSVVLQTKLTDACVCALYHVKIPVWLTVNSQYLQSPSLIGIFLSADDWYHVL